MRSNLAARDKLNFLPNLNGRTNTTLAVRAIKFGKLPFKQSKTSCKSAYKRGVGAWKKLRHTSAEPALTIQEARARSDDEICTSGGAKGANCSSPITTAALLSILLTSKFNYPPLLAHTLLHFVSGHWTNVLNAKHPDYSFVGLFLLWVNFDYLIVSDTYPWRVGSVERAYKFLTPARENASIKQGEGGCRLTWNRKWIN